MQEEKPVEIEPSIPVVQVPQGDTITIRVPNSKTIDSNQISLYLNDQPITTLNDDDSRFTIEKDGDTDNYVVIADVQFDDIGRYVIEMDGKKLPICNLEVTPARQKTTPAEPEKQVTVEDVTETEPVGKETPTDVLEDVPTHEVFEGDNVNFTIEQPDGIDLKRIHLLFNDKLIESDERVIIKSVSPTKTEISLLKVKLNDEGTYAIQFDDRPIRKLMKLKVLPKPVTRDTLTLPKETFEQGETLTITCEFDKKPDGDVAWKLNDAPITPKDERIFIETSDDGKSYTLTVKDLRPGEDQGIYSLEGPHLILETPFVRVIEHVQEEDEETTILVEEEETESFEFQPKPKKTPEEKETQKVR